jgi:hypothetical protein
MWHEWLPPVKDVVSKSVIPALQKVFDNSKRERLTTAVNKIHAETRRTSQRSPFKKIHQKVVRPTLGGSVVDLCLLQNHAFGHGTERTEATQKRQYD